MSNSDFGNVFDAMDFFGDEKLSLKEFSTFLESVKDLRMEKMRDMGESLPNLIKANAIDLFNLFDEDKNGKVSIDELYRTFVAIGVKRTYDQCKEQIYSISQSTELDKNQFSKLIVEVLEAEIMNNGIKDEQLRAKFLEADVDHSGFLTVDEIYSIFKKIGADRQGEDQITKR